jgi:hypothetical protein
MPKPRSLLIVASASALAVACAVTSSTLQHPQPTASRRASATSPGPRPSSTPSLLLTYTSEQGHFLLQYPQGFELYVDAKPSVDGVVISAPNSISLLSPSSPNYLLTIERFPSVGTTSLAELISQTSCIIDPANGQELTVAGEPALLYPETPCGPYGSSLIFLLHSEDGYLITIQTHAPFDDIADSVTSILATIEWVEEQ